MFFRLTLIALSAFLGAYSCSSQPEHVSASPEIEIENIRHHLEALASDEMEGRAPGSQGGDRAANYIRTRFREAGLQPAGDESFYQMVPLVGLRPDSDMTLSFKTRTGSRPLLFGEEFVAWPGVPERNVRWREKDLVFVGYGIHAPEKNWNDYEGADVRGKVVLILVNDPPSNDPEFFGGIALTYYGRWTYKLEEAARQGAAGAILIHNTDMAGYPWSVVQSSWSGEQFTLPSAEEKTTTIEAWITEKVADDLLRASNLSFEEARAQAVRSNFRAVELSATVSLEIDTEIRNVEAPNVIGLVKGADPELSREAILITTHYDHLGIGPEVAGDRIYNGAYDNASGTAVLLELARILNERAGELRRSVLLAAVTAEEQGLLGSSYYAKNPLIPLARTVVNINLDSVNVWGETENIVALGSDRSTAIEVVRKVAEEMKLSLSPDPFPEKGHFFRSDQFSLVKVGVPAVYYDAGTRYRGQPEDWGEELINDYTSNRYHQPGDEYDPSWSLEGAAQITELVLRTVSHFANQESRPEWNPGDPFRAERQRSLQEGR